MRRLLVLLLLALPVPALALTPGELLQGLRAEAPVRARFVERRDLMALDAPIVVEGTLSFTPPDRLVREDVAPEPATYTVEGDRVRVEAKGGTRTLSLAAQPLLAALVLPFRATLQGDLAAIEGAYTATVAGDATDWRLDLVPKDQALRRTIRTIGIEGGRTIRKVTIEAVAGDRIVTTLAPL
ncbi:MAG: hypothetical protein KDG89_05940 [Geminicoccaceae bacterium]|nr:hypothetical protein [Geminicoccaceae bacterium]